MSGLINNAAWLAGYVAFEQGYACPWGDESGRLGWLTARRDYERAEGPIPPIGGRADD